MYKRFCIHCKKTRYFNGDAVTWTVCIHIGLLLSWCNQVPCPAKEFWINIILVNLLSSTWSVPIMNFAGIVGSYSRQDAVKAMSLKQSFKKHINQQNWTSERVKVTVRNLKGICLQKSVTKRNGPPVAFACWIFVLTVYDERFTGLSEKSDGAQLNRNIDNLLENMHYILSYHTYSWHWSFIFHHQLNLVSLEVQMVVE